MTARNGAVSSWARLAGPEVKAALRDVGVVEQELASQVLDLERELAAKQAEIADLASQVDRLTRAWPARWLRWGR